ncbi:MAG: AI-2E family transporter [Rhodobacteraceae bacterium]|nr:AI-2E family transporter [Paracoccaceae bacterium]
MMGSTKKPGATGLLSGLVVAGCVVILVAGAKVAEDFLVPITLALLIGVIVAPLTNALERAGLPRAAGALCIVALTAVLLAGIGAALEPVIRDLMERAPIIWLQLRDAFTWVADFLRGIDEVGREVQEQVLSDSTESEAGPTVVPVPSSTDALLFVPKFMGQLLLFVGALFFFVLERESIYVGISRLFGAEQQAVRTRFAGAERAVSRYFLTILAINCVFGFLVAGVMSLIGMPSPEIWGLMAALMNFIPYLGPALLIVALAVAGQVVFDGGIALLPPLAFLGLNFIEGYFTTPFLVGRRLSMSPLLIFLSLSFWLWLWGPAGGIIALPLTVWLLAVTGMLREPISLQDGSASAKTSVPAPSEPSQYTD